MTCWALRSPLSCCRGVTGSLPSAPVGPDHQAPAADRPLGAQPAPAPDGGPRHWAGSPGVPGVRSLTELGLRCRAPVAVPHSWARLPSPGAGHTPQRDHAGDKPPSHAPAVRPTPQPSPAPWPRCPAPAVLTTGTHAQLRDAPRRRLHGLVGKGGPVSRSGRRTERSSRGESPDVV